MSMSSSGERITAAELERSKRARTIARNWLEAESTRLKLAGLDPELDGDGTPGVQMRPSKFGRPSPLDRVREARVSGLEIREFEKGLSGENNPSKTQPSDIAGAKSRIVEALIRAGKTSDQIQEYMDRISPAIDVYGLSNDPAVQSILFSKIMGTGGTQQLGLKDVVETIKMVSDMRGSPQSAQTDVAQVIQALGTFMSAMAKQNQGSDPAATFAAGMAAIQPTYAAMNESTKQALQGQIDLLRAQNQNPAQYLSELRETASVLGWGPREAEPPEISLFKLKSQDARESRLMEMRREDARDKRQSEFVKGITTTLQRAFESPILKEFGKNVGRSIGADRNPVVQAASQAPAAAAQAQLQNPMEEKFSLTCSTCKRTSYFSRSDLLKIEQSANGKWVCSCGAAYGLKNSSSGTDDKNKDNEGSPIV